MLIGLKEKTSLLKLAVNIKNGKAPAHYKTLMQEY